MLKAEWQSQNSIILTWPNPDTDWCSSLVDVEKTYLSIAKTITQYQSVWIIINTPKLKDRVQALLEDTKVNINRVIFFVLPYNDTWVRDYGPLTVKVDGLQSLLDFQFNGWGEKFDAQLDNQITSLLHQNNVFSDTPLTSIPLVLEGGSVDSDGQGTILTNYCLTTEPRNHLSRAEMETQLKTHLGARKILWCEHGHLLGDDTDGHIDTLARFCTPERICYVRCDNPEDPHYEPLQKMEAELQSFRTLANELYELVPLPLPEAQYSENGDRLPATYANFLIINHAVLVPTYNCPQDEEALALLKHCFPKHDIIGIDCRSLIEQHGSLHCVTMQTY